MECYRWLLILPLTSLAWGHKDPCRIRFQYVLIDIDQYQSVLMKLPAKRIYRRVIICCERLWWCWRWCLRVCWTNLTPSDYSLRSVAIMLELVPVRDSSELLVESLFVVMVLQLGLAHALIEFDAESLFVVITLELVPERDSSEFVVR